VQQWVCRWRTVAVSGSRNASQTVASRMLDERFLSPVPARPLRLHGIFAAWLLATLEIVCTRQSSAACACAERLACAGGPSRSPTSKAAVFHKQIYAYIKEQIPTSYSSRNAQPCRPNVACPPFVRTHCPLSIARRFRFPKPCLFHAPGQSSMGPGIPNWQRLGWALQEHERVVPLTH